MAVNLSPFGILSYPYLWKPRDYDGKSDSEDARYSCVLVFGPEVLETAEYQAMRQIAINKAQADFDGNIPPNFAWPFRRTAENEGNNKLVGPDGIFIRFKTKNRPGVVDGQGNEIQDASAVYAGCIARVSYSPFTYNMRGNVGLSLALNNVQVREQGERIDGRTNAKEDFGAIEGAAPLGSMAGGNGVAGAPTGAAAGTEFPF